MDVKTMLLNIIYMTPAYRMPDKSSSSAFQDKHRLISQMANTHENIICNRR